MKLNEIIVAMQDDRIDQNTQEILQRMCDEAYEEESEQMTLDEIVVAMESGGADSRHASELLIIIHDLRDELTRYKTDILLCQKLLQLEEGELVSPIIGEFIKEGIDPTLWRPQTTGETHK